MKSVGTSDRENFREFFRKFVDVFASFSRFSDLLGPAGTCSDALGYVRMRLDALGPRTISGNFGKFVPKLSLLQFL